MILTFANKFHLAVSANLVKFAVRLSMSSLPLIA